MPALPGHSEGFQRPLTHRGQDFHRSSLEVEPWEAYHGSYRRGYPWRKKPWEASMESRNQLGFKPWEFPGAEAMPSTCEISMPTFRMVSESFTGGSPGDQHCLRSISLEGNVDRHGGWPWNEVKQHPFEALKMKKRSLE